jgi:hypothetical protein
MPKDVHNSLRAGGPKDIMNSRAIIHSGEQQPSINVFNTYVRNTALILIVAFLRNGQLSMYTNICHDTI